MIVIICRVPIFGPVSGRAEGSVSGGPKTAQIGRGLAGARNGPNRTIFIKEIIKDLAPVRNRENRLLGPVDFWTVRFLVVCTTSAAKLRSPFARGWVASICQARGPELILSFRGWFVEVCRVRCRGPEVGFCL